ncbi:MAG: ABC transporter ATP-binding protein [Candidatus Sabulitectum sp.]|nr:ABC transporter ATP-binding protein [Candidatus Sabulitectum sp.]
MLGNGIKKWSKYLKWIFNYWRPVRKYMVFLILFTLLSSAVALGFPLVFRYLLDNVQTILGTPESAGFNKIILILVGLAAARFVAGLYPGARAIINSTIGILVRDDVFGAIMRKDWRFFNRFRPGDLTTRLTDDITDYPRIAWFSCSAFFRALESTSRLVFCMAVMFFISWKLTLLAMAPLPVMLFIFYMVEHRLGKKVTASRKATSHTNDLLDSTFDGIAIVKAYQAEKPLASRLHRLLDERFDIDFSLVKLDMIIHGIYSIIGQVGKVTVMLVGGLMVIDDKIGIGDFYAFYVYLDMLLAPMMDIPTLFVASRQAFVSIDREMEIMDFPEPERRKRETGSLERVTEIKLDGVSFSYDGGGGLKDLSFHIKAPSVIAVVGEVGSGKTTLLKILAGLLPPDKGRISVNGRDLAQVNITSALGYVPQDSVLLGESVDENVRFGRDSVSMDDVKDALKVAGIGEDELGEDKILGQRGVGASGGQRQRIAIARALAGKPSLLLLDDCTAALDAQKEEAFWENLRSGDIIPLTVVVTHREATVKQSEMVLFISNGRLTDTGIHSDLLENNSEYARVIRGMESEDNYHG